MLLAVVLVSAAAWAETSISEREPSTSRLWVGYGLTLFDSSELATSGQVAHFGGLPPAFSLIQLSGAYFFTRSIGVSLDGSFQWVKLKCPDTGCVAPPPEGALIGFRVAPELALRWARTAGFNLEGHVGVNGGQWPSYDAIKLQPAPVGYIGPTLGLNLALESEGRVSGMFYARGAFNFGTSTAMLAFIGGAQLYLGDLKLGSTVHGAIALGYELVITGSLDNPQSFVQFQNRLTLGLRYRSEPERIVTELTPQLNGVLKGRVVADGAGVAHAEVEAGGQQVQTDPAGEFTVRGIEGSVHVKAVAGGFKPAEQDVTVPHDGEATVTLTLVKPTGPGTIKGVVKSDAKADKPDSPIEGAEVTAEGRPMVKTAADGSFTVEKAGPGPVKVNVKAKGFAPGEEIVQVPAESEAVVNFALAKQGERAPATIRGLIVRAATGKPVKATVRINELNLNVQVKPDGRFVVQVPGGKYTVVIEAPGFVSQAKPVEVADGDQAIFHCELQPVGR
jgi:hypothetical protein